METMPDDHSTSSSGPSQVGKSHVPTTAAKPADVPLHSMDVTVDSSGSGPTMYTPGLADMEDIKASLPGNPTGLTNNPGSSLTSSSSTAHPDIIDLTMEDDPDDVSMENTAEDEAMEDAASDTPMYEAKRKGKHSLNRLGVQC